MLAKTADHYQWGKQILAKLSQDLTLAFSNARGYSEQNLRHMRQFYYMLGKGFAFIRRLVQECFDKTIDVLRATGYSTEADSFIHSVTLLAMALTNSYLLT